MEDLSCPGLKILRDLLVVLGGLLQDLHGTLIGHLGGEPAGDGGLAAVVERRVHDCATSERFSAIPIPRLVFIANLSGGRRGEVGTAVPHDRASRADEAPERATRPTRGEMIPAGDARSAAKRSRR